MNLIGSGRKPDHPKPGEVETAINIMLAFGSPNKEGLQQLKDLKAAIEHNEMLIEEINHLQANLGDLKAREAQVAEREQVEKRIDAKLKKADAIMAAVNYPKD